MVCQAAIRRALAAEGVALVAERVLAELHAAGSFVALDDLTGVAELAAVYRVGKSAVSNWAARYEDFPEPLRSFAMGKLYSSSEVAEWRTARAPEVEQGEGA